MNERQRELLRVLLGRGQEFQLIDRLAVEFGCSEKTIRNDLKRIESVLQSYPDAKLVRKQGIGVYLSISGEERAQLFQTLFSSDGKTAEERVIQIAYQLLSRNKPITIKQLAATYYTNNTTIKQDLEKIADWINQFDLTLTSKQRVGSSITGSELHKRNALAHLSELVSPVSERNGVLDLFPAYEITTVQQLLQNLQIQNGMEFTSDGQESLLIHALIMIRRTRQGSPITLYRDRDETIGTFAYKLTEQFLAQVEQQFQVSFPVSEKVYYTWHLLSSVKQTKHDRLYPEADTNIQDLVQQLIGKLQQVTLTPFGQDPALTDGLLIHLHAVVHRLSHGFIIRNPLLSDIKKMYPYMFSMTVLALEEMAPDYDLDIPEDEAAYLVLHFQASMERLEKQSEMKKRVLIVCHMGVGMSRLLQAKIEQQYDGIHVLDCTGQMEVTSFLSQNQVDFIISTVVLKSIRVPYVVVSPLLEAKDKARLNQFFRSLESNADTRKIDASSLLPLLDKQCIFLHVQLEHRYEVVEMLADALKNEEKVSKKFAHNALLRERASATAIGGGIAIPHARPDTVKQSAIAVAIMEKPLEWGNEMVSVVFLLAIAENEQAVTREVMQYISSVSGDPGLVHKLEQASKASDIPSILSSEENE